MIRRDTPGAGRPKGLDSIAGRVGSRRFPSAPAAPELTSEGVPFEAAAGGGSIVGPKPLAAGCPRAVATAKPATQTSAIPARRC
jgi:hypothetical protein